MIAIGIDVGGTQTRVGVVDDGGRIVASRRCETVRDADGGALVDRLARTIDEVLSDSRDKHGDTVPIGLALPGLLDRDRRSVVRSVSLPCLEGKPIADELARRTARPVYLATDAEAATWGEYSARSPRPRNFVHLRLGTGIGCGAVIDGQLQRLDLDRNGHLDELVIDDGPSAEDAPWRAPTCPCGKRGCLETVASGPVLSERAARAGFAQLNDVARLSTTSQSPERNRRDERPRAHAWGSDRHRSDANSQLLRLQSEWEQGDPGARDIVDDTARAIAVALTNLARRFNPEVISIGGGAATACPCLIAETNKHFRTLHEQRSARFTLETHESEPRPSGSGRTSLTDPRKSEPSASGGSGSGTSLTDARPLGSGNASATDPPPPLTIEPAILGDDAGILGAALLACDAFSAHHHAPMVNP